MEPALRFASRSPPTVNRVNALSTAIAPAACPETDMYWTDP